jgi:eukaryotic-like serine/threonine-protein kinase
VTYHRGAVPAEPVQAGASDAPIAIDTRIGDYRIRGVLGEGAMGEVYLAQDVVLGRRVALKLIRRELMDRGGVERFLDEARLTASFNHPHIVTVHAVGEYEGRPYLALEHVDGESLRTRIASGPMPVREALRLCRAIAEAVGEAHAHGVVHADLKPENVLVRRDGRVRVVDFGLAKLVGTSPAAASGTPAYMAPERWRGEAPQGAIDVWACGMILAELITGARPLSDAALAQLAYAKHAPPIAIGSTAPWAAVAADCIALDPGRRPSAAELVRRLERLIDPHTGDDEDADRCPFPGLAAFTRAEAAQYCGREDELDEIVERLRTAALVPIVGPSGIGKSSFVYAALVPRLEDGGWKVLVLRPGGSPFASLAAALGVGCVDEVAASLRAAPDRLSVLLGDVAARFGGKLLVFVDQFEEVFTLARDEAVAVCDCLAGAALADEPWRVVLTLRDDFLGRLAESARMRAHLGGLLVLPPLSTADLRAAITRPLANAGYDCDASDLPMRIVGDVEGQPACLPLLQFTCQQLWERRDVEARRILTREYEAIGGASGALADHAKQLMAELSPAQVRIARSVLLALLNPDGTRRPQLRSQLAEEPEGDRVIDRLIERRLIVSSRESDTGVARVELAHEALATAWPQLARWLDETSEQRLLVHEIEQATLQWQRRGRPDDATWGGAALDEAVRRLDEWKAQLPEGSRAFLAAGVRRQRAQRRRRRWSVTTAIALLAAVAVVAILVAIAFARRTREAELASADLGAFVLELEPFDWDATAQAARPPAVLPALTWRLREVDATEQHEPGREYTNRELRRGRATWVDRALVEAVQARAGQAFVEIDRGADCRPSLIFLRRLPGYTERAAGVRIRLAVPTCAATREGMTAIPAGDFWRNVDDANGGAHDELVSLPSFHIDSTEVTRGAFEMYGDMAAWTGDAPTPDGSLGLDPAYADWTPIVGVNFHTSRSYCRYLGKDLPTTNEWQKALRGGLVIGGVANPDPHRATPWLETAATKPANIDIGDRPLLARVGSYPDDRSPYGVADLVGNVAEWSMTLESTGLRQVLGGSWGEPPSEPPESQYLITWRNSRPDADVSFSIGVRCVVR